MRVLVAGVVVAVIGWSVGAAPAPAPAASPRGTLVAGPRFVPAAGPVLAGDALVWVTRRDDAVLDLWIAGPSGGARRIQRFVGSDTQRLESPMLSASSTHVGLEMLVVSGPRAGASRRVRSRAYLGALGQPLGRVSSCPTEGADVRSIDVGDAAAAFRARGCGHVTVRALARGAVAERRLPRGAFAARLAGPFEAWLDGRGRVQAVVRDGASGREVMRTRAGALPGAITDTVLRADGALALLHTRARRNRGGAIRETRVAFAGPGTAVPRPLLLTLLAPRGARWVGAALGGVIADRRDPRAGVLAIADTDGRTLRRIARLGRDRELMRHTDVSAGRAVWVTRGCESAEIRTVALPISAAVRGRAPNCRLRLVRRPGIRGDRLHLAISCAGFTIRCVARVTVRARGTVIARGTAQPNRSAPPYASASLTLRPADLRLLRAGRSIRARISARIAERGASGAPMTAGVVTRHTTRILGGRRLAGVAAPGPG